MEVFLISVFSAIIVFITVSNMMKAFMIAYKRNEISLRKFIIFSTSAIVTGVLVASALPFGYEKLFTYIS